MSLRKKKVLEIERRSTRSHCVENLFYRMLWTCRKADNRMRHNRILILPNAPNDLKKGYGHVVSLVARYSYNMTDRIGLRIYSLVVQLQASSACVLPRLSGISSLPLGSADFSIRHRGNLVIRKK
jgi:hypothetical protein